MSHHLPHGTTSGRPVPVRRSARAALGKLLIATGLIVGVFGAMLPAQAHDNDDENDNPPPKLIPSVVNPNLPPGCGVDLTLVLDRSGSIDEGEGVQIQAAAQLFVDSLEGTPSRVKTIVFADRAEGQTAAGALSSTIANVVFRQPSSVTIPSISGNGSTNWDDGLEVARRSPDAPGTGPSSPGDLVVLLTDGDPTRRLSDQPDGHDSALAGDGSNVDTANVNAAITEANSIRTAGGHMFGIGVGLGGGGEDRLKAVTGTDKLTFTGNVPNMPFGQADYTLAPDTDALKAVVKAFVRDLCAPSLNVVKYHQNANGTETVATGGTPWSFTATVTPTPATWQAPAQGAVASATRTTDGTGGTSFKWELTDVTATSGVALTETAQAGWVYNGAICKADDLDGDGPDVEVLNTRGTNVPGQSKNISELASLQVGPEQAVNCQIFNRQLRTSTIKVDKVVSPNNAVTDLDGFDFRLRTGDASGAVVQSKTNLHGDDAVHTFTAVGAGTYSLTEDAKDGYALSSSTCARDGGGQGSPASPVDLVVGEGETWTCTFTNTAANGSVQIVKELSGGFTGKPSFTFSSSIPALNEAVLTHPNLTSDAVAVAPGTYNLSENAPAPWALTNASCDRPQVAGSDNVNPATLTVKSNEAWVCTFTNASPAQLTVDKNDNPDSVEPGDEIAYTITYSNSGGQAATGVVLRETVPLNTTFVDDGVGGWDCNIGNAGDGGGAGGGTPCTYVVGSVPGGSNGSATFTVKVNAGVPAGTDTIFNTVAIRDSIDPNTNDDTADETTTVVADPNISVTKTDSKTTTYPGETFSYTITVSNTGDEGALGVVVSELLPAHTTFVGPADWELVDPPIFGMYQQTVNVPAGGSVPLLFTVTVDSHVPADVDAITNTVRVCRGDAVGCSSTDVDELIAEPDISVEKDDHQEEASPGEALTYDITYENTGDKAATDLVLSETVPVHTTAVPATLAGLGWTTCDDANAATPLVLEAGSTCTRSVANLPGGAPGNAAATGTVKFTVIVDAVVPVGATVVHNTVKLTDNPGEQDEVEVTGEDTTDLTHEADINVEKTDDYLGSEKATVPVSSVVPGQQLVYTITVSNDGDRDAEGVLVTESVPQHTSFVDGAPGNSDWDGPDGDGVYSQEIDLLAGEVRTFTFTVQVDDTVGADAFVVHNEVQACLEDDCDTGEDDDTLVADAVISVEKENEGDDGAVVPGETIVYVITVSNTGDRDIQDVVVTETVPGFTTFVEDAEGNDAWTVDGDEHVASVDVAAGTSEELTFTVKVQGSVPAGALGIHNSVTACPDAPVLQFARFMEIIDALEIFPVEGCSSGEDDDDLDAAPDLTVVKDDDGITVNLGGQVTYTIDYANTGDQDATGVVLTETVPTGSTFVGPADWACVGTTCTADIGDLAAGASGSIQFTVKVDAALASGQTDLDNVVVISDDGENGEDPNPEDNTGTDDTPVRPPEVLPAVVTRPTPPTQVQGAQLPRTGSDADQMLLLAGLLTMVGGLLLVAESVVDQRRRRVMVVRG